MNIQERIEPAKPRKEEILDVATRLFAERGYEGTSINDVAERVGMRKASLFYHFATKEALYASVLDRLLARLAVPLGAAYSREGSVVERFDIAVDVVTAILGESPFAARLLLREAMDWGPVIRGKLLEKVLVILELTTAFVREGQQAGAFVEGDAKQLVLTSLGAHFFPFAVGQLVERYVGLDPFDPGFVAARRAEVRRQLRNMIVRPGL